MKQRAGKRHGIGWFVDLPLNGKLAVIFAGGIILPFLLISMLVFGVVYRGAVGSERQRRGMNLEHVADSVDALLREYETAAEQIYNYETFLKDAAAAPRISADTLNLDREVNMMLSDLRKSREFLAGVSFVFADGTFVSQTSGYGRYEQTVREIEASMDDLQGQMQGQYPVRVWQASGIGKKEKGDKASYFSGRKIIRNIYDRNELVGLAVMHISALALEERVALAAEQGQGLVAVLDADNQLLFHSESPVPLLTLLNERPQELAASPGQLKECKGYYYICKESAYSGWRFVNFVPKGEVDRQSAAFLFYFIVIIGLFVSFAVVFLLLVRRFMTGPIRRLIVVMDEIDDLDKIPMQLAVSQRDEIGQLYQSYNRLNQRIDSLVLQLTDTLKQDREKEVRLLHSQLNPHFIYNTLESISWVAYEKEVPEVSKVVAGLSEILKYSIKYSDENVTFADELKMVKHYIEIQHFRFEDRFRVFYEIEEALLTCKAVKFIFQPFVENALLHGFRHQKENCRIVIRLFAAGENAAVEVEDNGCGMEEVLVHQTLRMDPDGIGIGNLNKSLRLRFGEQYQIQIDSAPGAGTKIHLEIPKMKGVTDVANRSD